MWFQICEKITFVSTTLLLEKMQKKIIKEFPIFGGFWGQN